MGKISAVLRIVQVVDRRLYAILDGKKFWSGLHVVMDAECGTHMSPERKVPQAATWGVDPCH